MARPKRSNGAKRLFVTVNSAHDARLEKLALKVTRETGRVTTPVELHRRGFAAMLLALESCRACRAGTCDGAHGEKPCTSAEVAPVAETVETLPIVEAILEPIQLEPPPIVQPVAVPIQIEVVPLQLVTQVDKPKRGRPPGSKNATKHAYPDGFALTDEMRTYAEKHGIDPARVADVFEHFSTHHRAKGSKFVDWTLAFYTWARNDKQFGGRNQARNARPASTQDEPLPEGWT